MDFSLLSLPANWREILAMFVIVIFCVNSSVYIRAIWRKEIKAHVFSWIIWATIGGIAGAAQLAGGGGVGAWPTLFAAFLCFVIALMALFYHGEKKVTRSDKISFSAALMAIPIWLMTDNPLWAALIVTMINGVAAYYPTFRKSWYEPFQENFFLFFTGGIACVLSAVALESYSSTTLLYPVAMIFMNLATSIMLVWRRRLLPQERAVSV